MKLGAGLRGAYFDRVYTPVYDATVGRLAPYRRLQTACLGRLSLRSGDFVLSIGVGTGNEVAGLFQIGPSVAFSVAAVDLSRPGLVKTLRKARMRGRPVDLAAQMDAQHLAFADSSFDRILCLHTMDFLGDPFLASREMTRVLKPGGEFVATYPAGRGGSGLAGEVRRSVVASARRGRVATAALDAAAAVGAGLAYLPLALSIKPQEGFFSRTDLEKLLGGLKVSELTVEEEPVYQDFIVWGRKGPS